MEGCGSFRYLFRLLTCHCLAFVMSLLPPLLVIYHSLMFYRLKLNLRIALSIHFYFLPFEHNGGLICEPQLPLAGVIDLLVRETAPTAGMRGAEERDLTLGRLFGLAAIARYANAHHEHSDTDAESPETTTNAVAEAGTDAASPRSTTTRAAPTEADAQRVLTLLLEVFNRRRWAREASVAAARDLLRVSRPRDVAQTLLPLVAAALDSEESSARASAKRHRRNGSSADAGAHMLGQLSPDHLALALCAEEALRRCAQAADDDDDDDSDDDSNEEEEEKGEEDDEEAAAAGVPSHAQVAAAAALFWPILRPPGFVRLSGEAEGGGEKMSEDEDDDADKDSDSSDDDSDEDEEGAKEDDDKKEDHSADVDSIPGGEEFAEFEAEVLAEGVPRVLRPGAAADALSTPLRLGSSSFPRLHLSWELVLDGLLVDPQASSGETGDYGNGDGNGETSSSSNRSEHPGAPTFPPQSMAAVKALWGGAAGTGLVGGTHQMKGTALALLPRVASRLPADHVGEVALTPSIVKLLLNSTVRYEILLEIKSVA